MVLDKRLKRGLKSDIDSAIECGLSIYLRLDKNLDFYKILIESDNYYFWGSFLFSLRLFILSSPILINS